MQILAVFEDRAFDDIVTPLIRRVAGEQGVDVELVVRLTHGCRFQELQELLQRGRPILCVIGADAGQHKSSSKEKAMRGRAGGALPQRTIFSIPEPSAEGWLQADLAALKRGVSEALQTLIHLPADAGPYPRDEKNAKQRVRSLLRSAGVPVLRDGLEYGPSVMQYVAYDAHPSLQRFVRDLRALIESA
jgi:hypothetical protein